MNFETKESTLPFYSMVDEINKAALSNDAESWSRAKAELITLYQKMLSSPDLTTREADLLFEKYKQTMFDLRKRAELVGMMSNDSKGIKPEGTAKLDRLVQDLEQTLRSPKPERRRLRKPSGTCRAFRGTVRHL